VLAFDDDLATAGAERKLWDHATRLLPLSGGDMPAYTQGLMDLGATVCTVRAPRCDACPVASICVARARDAQEKYPVKTRKLRRGQRAHALLWLQHADRVWLAPRPAQGVWASLWSMPEFEDGDAIARHVAAWPGTLEWLPPFRHVLTHFDWTLQPLRLTWHGELTSQAQSEIEALAPGGRWIARADLDTIGLPAPIRKLLQDAI
jgi:A/G-specific adenine glycosylase